MRQEMNQKRYMLSSLIKDPDKITFTMGIQITYSKTE